MCNIQNKIYAIVQKGVIHFYTTLYQCKHLGVDSSTDHPDRYSNLFLNAYINRHVHAKYLKMIL